MIWIDILKKIKKIDLNLKKFDLNQINPIFLNKIMIFIHPGCKSEFQLQESEQKLDQNLFKHQIKSVYWIND